MIKLIASDIDGTLINDEHQVTPYTKEIIQKARAQGIEFVIATGRNYESASEIAKQCGIEREEMAIISLNGLRVEFPNAGYSVRAESMSYEACKKMEEIGKKYFMGVMYAFEDVIYYHMDDVSFEDYRLGVPKERMVLFDDSLRSQRINGLEDIKHRFEHGSEILKMIYVQNGDYTELVKNRIAREFGKEFTLMLVGVGWAEIMPRHVNKGAALLQYAASRGIEADEIIAFGDSDNDLTMIKKAGTGVAMANARESLKIIADDITSTNSENGVAEYIEKHILNQE